MLKKSLKRINAEFIQTRVLPQLSFLQFRHYATSFLVLLLTLTLTSKNKKILKTSLDHMLSCKTSVGSRVNGLVPVWIIWKIGALILFKRNMAEKDLCRAHNFCSINCNFLFVQTFDTVDDLKINK